MGLAQLGALETITARQHNCEGTPLPRLAFDIDGTPVRANDTHHRSQSQAASGELGSEERIEDARPGRLVHADAGVLHLQNHLELGIGLARQCADGYGAGRLADGFSAVDGQVHHDLLDLGGIGLDLGEPRVQLQFQPYTRRKRCANQRNDLRNVVREVYPLNDEFALAGVREHLLHQNGGLLAGADDLGDVRLGGMDGIQVLLHQAGITEHAGQKIVEIVSQTAGEHP
jgi:hypothetical protein